MLNKPKCVLRRRRSTPTRRRAGCCASLSVFANVAWSLVLRPRLCIRSWCQTDGRRPCLRLWRRLCDRRRRCCRHLWRGRRRRGYRHGANVSATYLRATRVTVLQRLAVGRRSCTRDVGTAAGPLPVASPLPPAPRPAVPGDPEPVRARLAATSAFRLPPLSCKFSAVRRCSSVKMA